MVYSDDLMRLLDEALAYGKSQNKSDIIANILATKAVAEMVGGEATKATELIKKAEPYLPQLTEQQVLALLSDFTRIHTRIGNLQQSLNYYDRIDSIAKDKPQFIFQRVVSLKNRTNIEARMQQLDKALAHYKLALKLSAESGNPNLLKDTRFSYATLLLRMNKEKEAFEILKDLIPELDNSINDRTPHFFDILSRNYQSMGDDKNAYLYASKLFNLPNAPRQMKANTIDRMILLAFQLKDYANFEMLYAEHKKFNYDANSLYSKKQYLLAESRYYDVKDNFNIAKRSYLKALNARSPREITPTLDLQILIGLSDLHLRMGKTDSALLYLKKAEQLQKKTPVSHLLKLAYTKALKNYHQHQVIPADTLLKNLKQEMHLKDTLYQINLGRATQELETRYRVSEKEKELQLAKREQQVQMLELKQEKQGRWIIILVTLGVVFSAGILTFFLWQRKKQAALLHNATVDGLKKQHELAIMNTLSEAQEGERKRVAERLHDEVGAMLSIAKLNISTLTDHVYVSGNEFSSKLENTQGLMNNISETIRTISHALMPIAIEKYGFKAAVLDLISTIKTSETLTVEYVIEGFDDTQHWPQSFILGSYRMIQEIINNAIKHADASHLFIQLIELPETITILVEDNGKGFDEAEMSGGHGIKLLKTNIAHFDGKVVIEGKPNQGTFILIELPLPHIVTA